MLNSLGRHTRAQMQSSQPTLFAPSAWTLRAWPTVFWHAKDDFKLEFVHLCTNVTREYHPHEQISGQSLWACTNSPNPAGIAWDWILIATDLVALSDPMAIITNLRVLNPSGMVLSTDEAAPYINLLVHGLPWQTEVLRTLGPSAKHQLTRH